MKKISINIILSIICTSSFLFLLLAALALNPWSAIYSGTFYSNPQAYLYGTHQTQLATNQILLYVWFGQNYSIELSQQAQIHMSDVRHLFLISQILLLIFGILVIFLLRKKEAMKVKKIIKTSAIVVLSFVFLIGALSLFGFDNLFIVFHKIFFSNNLWLFPSTDSLIIFFPEYFFQTIFEILGTWFTICCCLLLFFLRDKTKKRLSSGKAAQHI